MATALTPSSGRARASVLIVAAFALLMQCDRDRAPLSGGRPEPAPRDLPSSQPVLLPQQSHATEVTPVETGSPLVEAVGGDSDLSIDPLRWVGSADSHAPPVPNSEELFFEMKKARVENLDGDLLLLCRVVVSGGDFDMFAEPDLIMELSVDGGPRVRQWGGLNSSVGYVSCPISGIEAGARVNIKVQDQDVTTVEHIGETSEVFEGGFPVELETRHVTATCRADSIDHLGPRIKNHLSDADAGLARIRRSTPKPKTVDWGFPGQEIARIRASLFGAASFIGWKDPDVAGRVRALALYEQAFSIAAAQSVDETVKGLLGQEVPLRCAGVALSVAGVSCREGSPIVVGGFPPSQPSLEAHSPYTCVIRLHIENIIQAPVVLDASSSTLGFYDEFRLVAENGSTADLVFSESSCTEGLPPEAEDRRVSIPSGQGCELELTNSSNGDGNLPEKPRLLWIDSKTAKPVLLPL